MSPADALVACETTVRRADPDRYLASLFAPADKRPLLHALYAFNHELAHACEAVREPLMAEARLQWWREAIALAHEGRPRDHPAEIGLAVLFSRGSLDASALLALVDAREVEGLPTPFTTLASMESHAGSTSAALMGLATGLLGPAHDMAECTREAGIAYGLAGMLRNFQFHAARGKLYLPLDLLADESLTVSDALSKLHAAAVKRVIERVALRAFDHFWRAREAAIPRTALPAVLPAALTPIYLSKLAKSADPLRNSSEMSQLRRQYVLLRAALRKRL